MSHDIPPFEVLDVKMSINWADALRYEAKPSDERGAMLWRGLALTHAKYNPWFDWHLTKEDGTVVEVDLVDERAARELYVLLEERYGEPCDNAELVEPDPNG